VLVNKTVHWAGGDIPSSDLVDITYTRSADNKQKMNAVAEKALREFLDAAKAEGFSDITVTSGYRTFALQTFWFNKYINDETAKGLTRKEAEEKVLTYSARPGTSDHHTGLAVDMHNLPAADQSFGETAAGKWLAENAHTYGFILRYPKGKQDITGYMWEPWHFRFVGLGHATKIYEQGICLEEYVNS